MSEFIADLGFIAIVIALFVFGVVDGAEPVTLGDLAITVCGLLLIVTSRVIRLRRAA